MGEAILIFWGEEIERGFISNSELLTGTQQDFKKCIFFICFMVLFDKIIKFFLEKF